MKSRAKNKIATWYSRMTPAELEAIAALFDREITFAETKPLTAAMQKQERKARYKVKPTRKR